MRVLIADDCSEVRSAIRILLEQKTGFEIVGEAGEVESLLKKLESEQPDLLLLDWELSDRSMAEYMPLLRLHIPGLRVIAMSGRPEAARAAREAGADAFISKGENSDRLLETIGRIAN
jgi:two-component system chemotaxis response regulator CheY